MPQQNWLSVKESVDNKLRKIINGDKEEREIFIKDYLPFIIKTVSNKTNRYIEVENSPEYMIGIEAFNEAIDKYDFSKGKFMSFASLVIKSRVTDFMRKEKRENNVITFTDLGESQCNALEAKSNIDSLVESFSLKDELQKFEETLHEFSISLLDLVRESPKHTKVRIRTLNIATYIYDNNSLKKELMTKKRLPISDISKQLKVTSKELSRYRKYIIATVIILDSNLDVLKQYILDVKGGVNDDI